MNKNRLLYFVAILSTIILTAFTALTSTKVPESVNDFRLLNVDGTMLSLKDYPNAKGFIVVFTCNHCPFAKLYPPRLSTLNTKYTPLGIPLIAISSTDTITYEDDTYQKMIEKAQTEKFNFPYLYDGEQLVAKAFGTQKTPHAYVIWKENNRWVVKYNGAIDDNGAEPDKVSRHFVSDAVEALLHSKNVSIKETRSIGCQIHFRK